MDRFEPGHFPPPDDVPAEVIAGLIDRVEKLSRRVITSTTDYFAVHQNECRRVARVARRIGLSPEQSAALVAWYDRSVLHQLQVGAQPALRSRAPNVEIRDVGGAAHAGRPLRATRRALGWVPGWVANRRVDIRAWYLRVTGRA